MAGDAASQVLELTKADALGPLRVRFRGAVARRAEQAISLCDRVASMQSGATSVSISIWDGDEAAAVRALNDGFSDYFLSKTWTVDDITDRRSVGQFNPRVSALAFAGSVPVGGIFGSLRSDRRVRVDAMAIAPEWRRHGVGRQLLTKLLDAAQELHVEEVHLEVLVQNERAIQFYRAMGFALRRRLTAFKAASIAGTAPSDVVLGGRERLAELPPLSLPPPLHRDRLALALMPDLQVAQRASPTEGWIVWRKRQLLEAGGEFEPLLPLLPASGAAFIDSPEGDPLQERLRACGWEVYAGQWEMVRPLAP